jgi:hypothetical protein
MSLIDINIERFIAKFSSCFECSSSVCALLRKPELCRADLNFSAQTLTFPRLPKLFHATNFGLLNFV